MRFNEYRIPLFLLAAFLFCAINTQSQAQTTSVSGVVTDSSSAALVGTFVRLTDTATKQASTTTTNGAGRYFLERHARHLQHHVLQDWILNPQDR